MANIKDMDSVVKAKHNEIKSKGLDNYYGDPDNFAVGKAYGVYDKSPKRELAEYLEATKVPKYVRLAKFLNELYYVDVDYEQAQVLLSDKDNEYLVRHVNVKTVYKEFKEIEKRAKKVNKRRAAKLRKYKDVRKFISGGTIRHILDDLNASHISKQNITALTNFFDNCSELRFLNSSKLTRKVR